MVKIRLNKKILLLITAIFLIGVVCLALYIFTANNNSSEKTAGSEQNQNTAQSNEESSTELKEAPEQLTPPTPTEPEMCKGLKDAVVSAAGFTPASSVGRVIKTENSGNLIECNYSKDQNRVVISIYEYSNDSEAIADLSKRKLPGYSGKNSGKYVATVLVVLGDKVNTDTADKLVDVALEKL